MVQKDNKLVISMAKVDAKLRYAGVHVLVSDVVKEPLGCCVAYEERNQAEYAFQYAEITTFVHSIQSWEGKHFLQILATTINLMVRSTRVKLYNENADNKKYRVHYDSDRKLLAKLNSIYMTKFDECWMFDKIVSQKK